MKIWTIPVSWEMMGTVEVEADTLEEAIGLAECDDIPLPDNGEYVSSSWRSDCVDEDFIRQYYNNNQEDDEEEEIEIRYYVCGIGYDINDCVTDYTREFGDFDTEEEAQDKFDEAVREAEDNLDEFFRDDEPKVAYWKIQLEQCEETETSITCIDILDESNIYKAY